MEEHVTCDGQMQASVLLDTQHSWLTVRHIQAPCLTSKQTFGGYLHTFRYDSDYAAFKVTFRKVSLQDMAATIWQQCQRNDSSVPYSSIQGDITYLSHRVDLIRGVITSGDDELTVHLTQDQLPVRESPLHTVV